MDWSDRLIWIAVGAVLGYIVRLLQDIRREVHDVDEKVEHLKDEAGFVRIPIVLDALLILMVVATLYSIVRVEVSVDNAKHAVEQVELERIEEAAVTECNRDALEQITSVFDTRLDSTKDQLQANLNLVLSEAKVFRRVLLAPGNDDVERLAIEEYLTQVEVFKKINENAMLAVELESFPTPEDLERCYDKEIPND